MTWFSYSPYQLVHDTFVTILWNATVLKGTIPWLRNHRYDIRATDVALHQQRHRNTISVCWLPA